MSPALRVSLATSQTDEPLDRRNTHIIVGYAVRVVLFASSRIKSCWPSLVTGKCTPEPRSIACWVGANSNLGDDSWVFLGMPKNANMPILRCVLIVSIFSCEE